MHVDLRASLQVAVGTELLQMAAADSHLWPCQLGTGFWLSSCLDCCQAVHQTGDSHDQVLAVALLPSTSHIAVQSRHGQMASL